ncbi:MAG: 16S rRNA (adenine(1518)-N(6)/adenine(1519)-N(6))-dimethyltransferase RsmA [Candidatus Gracilibacteria bacterium]
MFAAKKSLGQNFLQNHAVLKKIIAAAQLTNDEIVIEVGPGMGALTEYLLKEAQKVIAIEKDTRLFKILSEKFAVSIESGKLELINGDALKIPPPNGPFKLVANIPYYITSPLIDHFVRDNPQNLPKLVVLLMQKEVAEKICAVPPHMNVLALHIQTFGDPKIIGMVSRHDFKPVPRVDSAILKIEFSGAQKVECDLNKYFELIHTAFSQKRKMLRAVLDANLLKKAAVDPTRRPETLSAKEWEYLSSHI